MEHIVQFAIGFDDDAVRRRIEECAYKDVVKTLTDEARSAAPKRYGGNVDWRYVVDEAVSDFVDKHKDEVIAAAADKLYESMRRSKAVKEAVSKAVEE